MKNNILLTFVILNFITYSQTKEFIVIDSETKLPISQVQAFYENLNEGSITNNDGRIKINLRKEDLSFIHLNYKKLILEKDNFIKQDTISLNQKIFELEEVTIINIDLNKKLNFVLDNFTKLYVNYPTEKECSLKETFLLDNKLKRLFLANLRLWSLSSELKYKKKYNKFIKIRLGKINYNKSEPLYFSKKQDKENNSGSITTKSLINFFYLNHAIKSLLLPSIGKIKSSIEKRDKEITIISYQTNWNVDKNGISNRNFGEITFDNKSNAILKFKKNIEFKNRITKKENSKIEYKNNTFEYNFIKTNNNKWSLKYFDTSINVLLTFKDKVHALNFSNSLSVFKETQLKKVNNKGIMNLDIPIYKNIPSDLIINSNNLMLTEKEKKFINKNTTHNNQ